LTPAGGLPIVATMNGQCSTIGICREIIG
jgi:hypothetical protein